ncbi:MAG TPA: methyltransferase [Candidatus Methylomirabilis sp.]|nr:methyltransferase [Candidatus Methylomirabilis sp.]
MTMATDWDDRNRELASVVARQPYELDYRGIRVRVDRDVFPPDVGFTTLFLAEVLLEEHGASRALDMGTGTLLLALVMRKAGVPDVWAVDNHEPAIRCARANLERNPSLAPVTIVQGDLFEAIPGGDRFDLIVFNQPYYPVEGTPIVGLGSEGGRAIIDRFLGVAADHLTSGGRVVMPFSSIAGEEHDPGQIAGRAGWQVTRVRRHTERGLDHRIYSMRPR